MFLEYSRKVNGNVKTGVRPYINFMRVRYSSDFLRGASYLIGQKVIIKVDPTDLRNVSAYSIDTGDELGTLFAAKSWSIEPHDLRMRKDIWRKNNKLTFDVSSLDNPVESYLAILEQDAKTNRKKRARLQNILKNRSKYGKSQASLKIDDTSVNTQFESEILEDEIDLSNFPSGYITGEDT